VQLANGMGHLTYSTLVHPADGWDEIWASLREYLPRVKRIVCPDDPFGVSLRISGATAETLIGSPEKRAELRDFLADNDMYLYTVNAFPHGPFKNRIVKEQVYEPDWSSETRLRYTMNVATILADIAPDFVDPSIQTPPLGFKPNVTGPAVIEAYAENIRKLVTHVNNIRRYQGRTVTLAIEPEPACFLETTAETIEFFNSQLRSPASIANLAAKTGSTREEAEEIMSRHVGVVYDICHQAVEYEDITESLRALKDAGIGVWKLQEAAAMRIPKVTGDMVAAVRKYARTIYLTQTHQRTADGKITRFLNLEDANRRLGTQSGAMRMAHPFPCAGLHGGSRSVQIDALRHRRGAGLPEGAQAIRPARDRNLYLGRSARRAQDRRHRRLHRQGNRVGEVAASLRHDRRPVQPLFGGRARLCIGVPQSPWAIGRPTVRLPAVARQAATDLWSH